MPFDQEALPTEAALEVVGIGRRQAVVATDLDECAIAHVAEQVHHQVLLPLGVRIRFNESESDLTVGTWEDKDQGLKRRAWYDQSIYRQEPFVSKENLPCGWYSDSEDERSAFGMASNLNADRFPWCSEKEEEDARTAVWDNMNVTSQLFGGERVNMGLFCGEVLKRCVPGRCDDTKHLGCPSR